MAGIYDRVTMDACHEEFDQHINSGQFHYNLNLKANMRLGECRAPFYGRGMQPDFYGPLRGMRTTQESFLQGRGHCLNNCPDCDVVTLPTGVFRSVCDTKPTCDRTDLDPMYTRLPRSCNGLTETLVYEYGASPERHRQGYQGYNAVVKTQLQSRDGIRIGPDGHQVHIPRRTHAQAMAEGSYGGYGATRDFRPYMS